MRTLRTCNNTLQVQSLRIVHHCVSCAHVPVHLNTVHTVSEIFILFFQFSVLLNIAQPPIRSPKLPLFLFVFQFSVF